MYSLAPTPRQTRSPVPMDNPTPMEIDITQRRGSLSNEEKQRRRANRLCLYCGGPRHIAIHCSRRPRRQVNQIHYDNKNESNNLEVVSESNIMNNPPLSNKFEVLSQLEEESNE